MDTVDNKSLTETVQLGFQIISVIAKNSYNDAPAILIE
jgi:hypothetical protein